MISLRRYIDSNHEELVGSILDSYRASITATQEFGAQACPQVGQQFQASLLSLREHVEGPVTPAVVAETQRQVEQQLKEWGVEAAEYLRQMTSEMKDLMLVLARTAESVGERDQRYTRQFADFSAQLTTIADLNDLTRIRASLVSSAAQLKTCVERMAQDSQESLAQMKSQLATYQARLEETERLAARDSLTGLVNRGRVEMELELRQTENREFCLLLLDINQFKQVNDELGHLAGDELLKQFAAELKSAFRPTDVVGRWGGDEFLAVLDCPVAQAEASIERIRGWVFGEYTLRVGDLTHKVKVSAAIGIASWQAGDSIKDILARADQAMYRDKRTSPAAGAVSAPRASAR